VQGKRGCVCVKNHVSRNDGPSPTCRARSASRTAGCRGSRIRSSTRVCCRPAPASVAVRSDLGASAEAAHRADDGVAESHVVRAATRPVATVDALSTSCRQESHLWQTTAPSLLRVEQWAQTQSLKARCCLKASRISSGSSTAGCREAQRTLPPSDEALVMVAEGEQLVVDDDSERAGECRSVVLRGPVSTLRRIPFPQNRRAVCSSCDEQRSKGGEWVMAMRSTVGALRRTTRP
jgi:hypothetical protein